MLVNCFFILPLHDCKELLLITRSLSVTHSNQPVRCDKLQSAEVKDLLLCFLFVVKHLGDDCLIAWWHQCTEMEVMNFFKGLE